MTDYVNGMKEKILGRGNKNIKNSEPRKRNKQTNKQNKTKKPQNPNLVCSKKSQNCSVTEGTSVFKWRIT